MKRKDITPGKTYIVSEYGNEHLALVTSIKVLEKRGGYSWEKRGTHVRVFGQLYADNGKLRSWDHDWTLAQVRREQDLDGWLEQKRLAAVRCAKKDHQYQVAREHVRAFADALAAAGFPCRAGYNTVKFTEADIAQWAEDQCLISEKE